MATTMQVLEASPAEVPALDPYVAVDPRVVWSRIEEWIAYRWGPRAVAFVVEGFGGCWRPPLTPFTLIKVESWDGGDWTELNLPADAVGGWRLGSAQYYRFNGTVGADMPPPPEVMEAARRLQAFWAAAEGEDPSATQGSRSEGDLTITTTRPRDWLGRSIHSSGATDLLRRYRRAP